MRCPSTAWSFPCSSRRPSVISEAPSAQGGTSAPLLSRAAEEGWAWRAASKSKTAMRSGECDNKWVQMGFQSCTKSVSISLGSAKPSLGSQFLLSACWWVLEWGFPRCVLSTQRKKIRGTALIALGVIHEVPKNRISPVWKEWKQTIRGPGTFVLPLGVLSGTGEVLAVSQSLSGLNRAWDTDLSTQDRPYPHVSDMSPRPTTWVMFGEHSVKDRFHFQMKIKFREY